MAVKMPRGPDHVAEDKWRSWGRAHLLLAGLTERSWTGCWWAVAEEIFAAGQESAGLPQRTPFCFFSFPWCFSASLFTYSRWRLFRLLHFNLSISEARRNEQKNKKPVNRVPVSRQGCLTKILLAGFLTRILLAGLPDQNIVGRVPDQDIVGRVA